MKIENRDRIFAIANWIKDRSGAVKALVPKLSVRESDAVLIYVNNADYTQDELKQYAEEVEKLSSHKVEVIGVDKEPNGKNRAAFKNFILKDISSKFWKDGSFPWFYMVEDNIEFLKDPSQFYSDIEELIEFLDYGTWFNTITDVCNLVFDKYDPRSNIVIDVPKYQKIFSKTICWCSHSNPSLFIINTKLESKEKIENGFFDDSFYIPMFWIIKYLAVRSVEDKGQYFMNFYPTVESERGVFKKIEGLVDEQISRDLFIAEDKKFKEQNISIEPCTDVQYALDFIYSKFNKREKENDNK